MRFKIIDVVVLLSGVVGLWYVVANDPRYELIADNTEIFGSLDELAAMLLFWYALFHFRVVGTEDLKAIWRRDPNAPHWDFILGFLGLFALAHTLYEKFELIPDSLPFVGHLDDGMCALILFIATEHFKVMDITTIGNFSMIILGVAGAAYLAFNSQAHELISDELPFLGALDEMGAAGFVLLCLTHFGIIDNNALWRSDPKKPIYDYVMLLVGVVASTHLLHPNFEFIPDEMTWFGQVDDALCGMIVFMALQHFDLFDLGTFTSPLLSETKPKAM